MKNVNINILKFKRNKSNVLFNCVELNLFKLKFIQVIIYRGQKRRSPSDERWKVSLNNPVDAPLMAMAQRLLLNQSSSMVGTGGYS